ncbi:hypothetical protein cypCar_00040342 [Cyprinus carpio]|nr:hypothetical protein cypCar_00040342 [Cyprinus carpio]
MSVTDVFETTSVDLSVHLDSSASSLIADDDDDGGVCSSENVSALSRSEDGVVQKDDSGIYDIQTPPVILNMEPEDDEVATFTPKTVS